MAEIGKATGKIDGEAAGTEAGLKIDIPTILAEAVSAARAAAIAAAQIAKATEEAAKAEAEAAEAEAAAKALQVRQLKFLGLFMHTIYFCHLDEFMSINHYSFNYNPTDSFKTK